MRTPRSLDLGRLLAVLLVGAAALPWIPGTAPAAAGFSLTRLAGANRYETAKAVAEASFTSADTALLARGDDFPDALAGSYLAGVRQGPILLTARDAAPAPTLAALASLKVRTVVLLGGSSAISDAVAAQLAATDSTNAAGGKLVVERVGGANRYATAALLARTPATVGTVDGKRTAIVATGARAADALVAGPLSYAATLPLVLTQATALSPEARDALAALQIQHVLLLGGPSAVSDSAKAEIEALGATVTRIAGADRTATATAIADYAVANLSFSTTHVNLARGDDFPDALAGGPHGGGSERAPTLLTASPTSLGGPASAWLVAKSPTLTSGHVFGGAAAVNDATVSAAETAGRTSASTTSSTSPTSSTAPTSTTSTTVSATTYDGDWLGTTSQGEFIGFNVESNAMTFLIFDYATSGTCESEVVELTEGFDPSVPITGTSLTHLSESPPDPEYTITVTFASAISASGTLHIVHEQEPGCANVDVTFNVSKAP